MNRIEIENWLASPANLSERERLIRALEYYSTETNRLEIELYRREFDQLNASAAIFQA